MLTLLFIGYSASAQIDFGPRVALTSTTMSLSENLNEVQEGDAEFGYQFGVFLRFKVPILGLYAQPELLFSSPNSTISVNNQDLDLSFNQIDLPVMIGGKIGPLRINAGPSFRFLTNAESDFAGTVNDVKENYKDVTVGYQAGIGIDVLRFVIDLKYEGSFGDVNDGFSLPGGQVTFDQVDQRVNQWVFAVGFKLF